MKNIRKIQIGNKSKIFALFDNSPLHTFLSMQNAIISFEYVDFLPNIYLNQCPSPGNLTAHIAIIEGGAEKLHDQNCNIQCISSGLWLEKGHCSVSRRQPKRVFRIQVCSKECQLFDCNAGIQTQDSRTLGSSAQTNKFIFLHNVLTHKNMARYVSRVVKYNKKSFHLSCLLDEGIA